MVPTKARTILYISIISTFISLLVFLSFYGVFSTAASPVAVTPPDPNLTASISKPSDLVIVPPWQNGKSHKISNGYTTGRHFPENCQSPAVAKTKDCYALDFDGSFTVTAVATGKVKYAGWTSGGYGTFGQVVYICHGEFDTNKGTLEICSFYAHLDSIDPSIFEAATTGEEVEQGAIIGDSGHSGCHNRNFPEFEAHLHFALHAGSTFATDNSEFACDKKGGTGPHSGYAVVPEPFSDCEMINLEGETVPCEDLLFGQTLKNTKTPPPDTEGAIDLFMIVDLSGSFADDLSNFQAQARGLISALKASNPDIRFGLARFEDYPIPPFGSTDYGDKAYERLVDLTSDTDLVLDTISNLSTRSGVDGPESQLTALYQAATGAGQDLSGAGFAAASIPSGQQASFR